MREDLEEIKQRISLLEYLQRRNWTARRVGSRQEFVGFCPLHAEKRPSFYVNAGKMRIPAKKIVGSDLISIIYRAQVSQAVLC